MKNAILDLVADLVRFTLTPGPEVIKLFEHELVLQIVLRAPNHTRTQEVEVIKLFRTHTQVEYKSVISRVSSIAYLEPYSKLFLCEILFPMKSIKQNLTNDFNSSSVSPNIICLYTFAFCGE